MARWRSVRTVYLPAGRVPAFTAVLISARTSAATISHQRRPAAVIRSAPALMAEHDYFAVVCQYPSTTGLIHDLKAHIDAAHAKSAAFIVCGKACTVR